jgi:hydrogenase maturation protein HypF
VIVCDLHPGYATTGWAERFAATHPQVRLVRVQHHLAHALSLLAEHGVGSGPVLVATLDGTGYGLDGTIWGGELLVLGDGPDRSPWSWRRAWNVPTFPLVGGDRAIRQPWRVAQGLAHAWDLDIAATQASLGAPSAELRLVASQLVSGRAVVATSSAGRLFDAAAALLGICLDTTYEAQAAMELERAASAWRADPRGLEPPGSLRDVFVDLLAHPGRPIEERAWRFHLGLASGFAQAMIREAALAGTSTVGLTGGVALNRVFTAALVAELRTAGLEVLTHRVVPPNDGGLSLGQAWAGRLAAELPDTDA